MPRPQSLFALAALAGMLAAPPVSRGQEAVAKPSAKPTTAGAHTSWFQARLDRLPMKKEAWQDIAWVTDLGEARRQAAATGRPIFLWSMNGNPLGCT